MSFRLAGVLCLCLVLFAGPAAAFHFSFDCPADRYVSILPGQSHRFVSPLQSVPPGNDRVEVRFRPHLPETWSAQWSLQSNGEAHLSDGQVDLVAGVQDRLRVDVITESGALAYGWIDVTIRATEDSLEVAHCTYTVYAGLPVPPVDWDINCTNNTLYLQEAYSYFEIHNPLVNRLSVEDTLLVQFTADVPYGWGMHFHHHGVCFLNQAELPLPANSAPDSMIVMGGISYTSGMGAGEMVLQSKRNPSLAKYCHYRVIYDAPEDVSASAPAAKGAISVSPNPSSGEAVFSLRRPEQTSGALSIFGADGHLVRSFPRIATAESNGSIRWDGRDRQGALVPPGIYFYRFGEGSTVSRGTIVRLR